MIEVEEVRDRVQSQSTSQMWSSRWISNQSSYFRQILKYSSSQSARKVEEVGAKVDAQMEIQLTAE
jgi:hypothetical protein